MKEATGFGSGIDHERRWAILFFPYLWASGENWRCRGQLSHKVAEWSSTTLTNPLPALNYNLRYKAMLRPLWLGHCLFSCSHTNEGRSASRDHAILESSFSVILRQGLTWVVTSHIPYVQIVKPSWMYNRRDLFSCSLAIWEKAPGES